MSKPAVEIEVDDATGRWTVDGLPMILLPQHFFLNNHRAVEAELGAARLEAVLRPAGHRSAYHWCEREAAYHGLSGADVFRHYMKRLSQRGWAQFSPLALDPHAGTAEVRVDHSPFVNGEGPPAKGCYVLGSWLEGALDFVVSSSGGAPRSRAQEVHCRAEGQHDHCLFRVAPAPAV